MQLCRGTKEQHHADIAHHNGWCPLCSALEALDIKAQEIHELDSQLEKKEP